MADVALLFAVDCFVVWWSWIIFVCCHVGAEIWSQFCRRLKKKKSVRKPNFQTSHTNRLLSYSFTMSALLDMSCLHVLKWKCACAFKKKKKKRNRGEKVHCLTSLHDFYNLLLPGCNIYQKTMYQIQVKRKQAQVSFYLRITEVETKIWVSGVAENLRICYLTAPLQSFRLYLHILYEYKS